MSSHNPRFNRPINASKFSGRVSESFFGMNEMSSTLTGVPEEDVRFPWIAKASSMNGFVDRRLR